MEECHKLFLLLQQSSQKAMCEPMHCCYGCNICRKSVIITVSQDDCVDEYVLKVAMAIRQVGSLFSGFHLDGCLFSSVAGAADVGLCLVLLDLTQCHITGHNGLISSMLECVT